MKETKIISDKFLDLSSYITRERDSYSNANPYPHIVIKDFFNEDFLDEILKSFPDLSKINSSEQWKNKNEVKFGNNDCLITDKSSEIGLSSSTGVAFSEYNSCSFIDKNEKVTDSYKPRLINACPINLFLYSS